MSITDQSKFVVVLSKHCFDEMDAILAKHKSKHYLTYMSDALIHLYEDEHQGHMSRVIKSRYSDYGTIRRVGVDSNGRGDVVVHVQMPTRPAPTALKGKWVRV